MLTFCALLYLAIINELAKFSVMWKSTLPLAGFLRLTPHPEETHCARGNGPAPEKFLFTSQKPSSACKDPKLNMEPITTTGKDLCTWKIFTKPVLQITVAGGKCTFAVQKAGNLCHKRKGNLVLWVNTPISHSFHFPTASNLL